MTNIHINFLISQVTRWLTAYYTVLHTPRYYIHHYITHTTVLHTPRYYTHHDIKYTTVLHTPRYYTQHGITHTTILHTPRYYIHHDITYTTVLHTSRYCNSRLLTVKKPMVTVEVLVYLISKWTALRYLS